MKLNVIIPICDLVKSLALSLPFVEKAQCTARLKTAIEVRDDDLFSRITGRFSIDRNNSSKAGRKVIVFSGLSYFRNIPASLLNSPFQKFAESMIGAAER